MTPDFRPNAGPAPGLPPWDVLGLGCVAVDDLLYVDGYPPADQKTPILRRERQCGGLTATALVTAARLDSRCAYAGTLGGDDLSRFVLDRFAQEGIDTRWVVRREAARPVASTIIVDERGGTRNIFYDLTGAQGAADDAPAEVLIRGSRVLLVDHFGIPGMIRAGTVAREAGVAVVADLERDDLPGSAELLALADHVIVSADFALRLTGAPHPAEALGRLWATGRAVVVVTDGAAGCWFQEGPNANPCHQPAYGVKVVDTTGCGDVFHGAYASGLARGLALAERVRLAAATAALKATAPGGQTGIPNLATVERFLAAQESAYEHS
jgi:ribokinase